MFENDVIRHELDAAGVPGDSVNNSMQFRTIKL